MTDLIGICGDHCLYCPRYLATRKGSLEALEQVKELWVRLGLRDPAFPARDLACLGCRPDNPCAYPEIRACVWRREIANCGYCKTYPCPMISTAFEKTEKLRSRAIRVCSPPEMNALERAFFFKPQNLDQFQPL